MTIHLVRILIGLSVLLACVGGCAATDPRPIERPGGAYRDLEPAISYAVGRNEMAVVDHLQPPDQPGLHVYKLVTVGDEPAELRIQMPEGADPRSVSGPPARPLSIEASVGRFGDPVREQRLVRSLRSRLRALEKDGVAPIPD
jgi:hypothetical protein